MIRNGLFRRSAVVLAAVVFALIFGCKGPQGEAGADGERRGR